MNKDRGAGLNHEGTKSTKEEGESKISFFSSLLFFFVLFVPSWLISPGLWR